jgi:hypothetical protein
MQYRVIEPFIRIETTSGDYTLYRGQLVRLPYEVGIRMSRAGQVKCEDIPASCDHSVFAEQVIQGNMKQWVECGLYRGICNQQRGEWT